MLLAVAKLTDHLKNSAGLLFAGSENSQQTNGEDRAGVDIGWLPSFPHVLIASMSNFLFGYHIG